MKRCQIIPANVYDNLPPVVYEDDKWRYIVSNSGHFTRIRRKICFSCSQSAVYVIIFNYKKHNRVERCCVRHAQGFANASNQELPELPKIPQEQLAAIPKWTSIKIRI
ncbi:MAG TPA: hypothetical protein VL854_06195 [Nitrososphaeraceae archaeon]|nr:hypothetical protein [Nitrososphaeraceae archaeon]